MAITDNDWIDFMRSTSKSLGSIEEGQKNLYSYIGKVSEKADDIRSELTAHKDAPEAHGAGVKHRTQSVFVWIGGLLLNLLIAGFTIYRVAIVLKP